MTSLAKHLKSFPNTESLFGNRDVDKTEGSVKEINNVPLLIDKYRSFDRGKKEHS